MKKWETMTINGERFEVNTVDLEVENNLRGYGGIYGAYDNPSIYKKVYGKTGIAGLYSTMVTVI